jgi:ELWxxDGT repeat protein
MKKISTSHASVVRCWILRSIVVVALLNTWSGSIAQIHLIKDINATADPYYNDFGILVAVDERLFFYSPDGLSVSDGTTAGTSFVAPFYTIGAGISFQHEFIFAGDDGGGQALWKSDGTPEGTIKLKDIAPHTSYFPGEEAGSFTIVGETVFFSADDGVSGVELWKTDGTIAGTVRVKDIKPGAASSNPSFLTAVNGKLFFVAPSGNNKGIELWTSDGSTAGTMVVRDIFPGSNSSDPSGLVNVNGVCFFAAKDGIHGKELWKSDGTAAGTVMVKDIRPGAANSSIAKLTAVNDIVFFEAHDGVHGKELWKSDGTVEGTVLVKDITPGPSSSAGFAIDHLSHLFSHNGILYFVAFHHGHGFWRSDGTTAGTYPLSGGEFAFLYPHICVYKDEVYFMTQVDYDYARLEKTDGTIAGTSTIIEYFANFDYGTYAQLKPAGDKFYFVAQEYQPETQAFGGTKLMISDGTASGTHDLYDGIDVTLGSEPQGFINIGNKLFFTAYEGENYFHDLWTTDGTTAGTLKLKDLRWIHDAVVFNDELLFGADADYSAGEGVWITDGTEAGTQEVAPVGLAFPAVLNDAVLFSGDGGTMGWELWKTDGTGTGTSLLKEINTSGSGYPQYLTTLGNQVVFRATDDTNDSELWTSDGTTAGTFRLKNINPSGTSNLLYFKRAGTKVFFIADDGTHGSELWVTDGTAAGTLLTRDIAPGSSTVDNITALGDNIIFTAIDQYGSKGLWYSDGTTDGTYLLKDFYLGQEIIDVIGVNGSDVLMVVTDMATSLSEIWKTDATETGTIKLYDVNRYAAYTDGGVSLDGVFYFNLTYGPAVLWRSDGTVCGTYPVGHDHPIGVGGIASVNGKIIFNGNASEAVYFSNYGAELYGYTPEAAVPCAAVARHSTEAETIAELAAYPNPSKNHFVVNIPGIGDEQYSMEIINLNGGIVEQEQQLFHNRDYTFGSHWVNGVYVMKAVVNGKLITRKLVKTK